jgi:hypothetical protein
LLPPAPPSEVSSIPAVSRIRFWSLQARRRPRRRSRPCELAGARRGRGSCLHCSRVWAVIEFGSSPALRSLYARFGPAAPLPRRVLDFAAIGAAPAEMRSPPWPASWELGYGLTLCRKRRKP